MSEKKILFSTKYFDIEERVGVIGMCPYDLSVIIMPYVRGANGLPEKLGVLKEFNPYRNGEYSTTLITGMTEGADPDIFTTAQRELKEESGYDVAEPVRWTFLGFLTTSKRVDQEHPCFAVDITGVPEPEKPEGDGSEVEKKSEFMLMPVKDALESNDCLVPSLFLKLFRYQFGFTMKMQSAIPEEMKTKLMEIPNVNSVYTNEGGEIVIGLRTEMKDATATDIKKIMGDIRFKTEVVGEIKPQEDGEKN